MSALVIYRHRPPDGNDSVRAAKWLDTDAIACARDTAVAAGHSVTVGSAPIRVVKVEVISTARACAKPQWPVINLLRCGTFGARKDPLVTRSVWRWRWGGADRLWRATELGEFHRTGRLRRAHGIRPRACDVAACVAICYVIGRITSVLRPNLFSSPDAPSAAVREAPPIARRKEI